MPSDNVTPMPERLHRWTLNLVPPAREARDRAAARQGLSTTDVGNRAVQLYDMVTEILGTGGEVILRYPDGRERSLTLL